MPRDASGVYHLPAGNPVQSQTVIASTWANTTMQDVADALTGSLPLNGAAAMTDLLTLAQKTPTTDWNAAPKNYVDSKVTTSILPIGAIVMWAGLLANVPAGWHVCDGTNGTVNLVNRYPFGINADGNINLLGGSNTTQLSTTQLPYHNHTAGDNGHAHGASADTQGDHGHNIPYANYQSGTGPYGSPNFQGGVNAGKQTDNAGSHSHNIAVGTGYANISVGYAGSGAAWDSRPAFAGVYFIQRIA